MADYSELMKLERKVKQSSLSPGQTGQRDVAGLPASTQAGKQTTQQASLHANLQTSKDTSTQADKPASTTMQTKK